MACFLQDLFNCKKCFEYFLNKMRNKIKFFERFFDSKNNASGVLGGIRTHDLTIRNHTLYPAELQGHKKARNLLGKPLTEWIRFIGLLQLFV